MLDNTTVIFSVKSDNPDISITVENKFKEINLVPDFGGTTVKVIERDYSKL